MEFLTALWLPILLSAVAIFVISSLIHMVFGYHAGDYAKLPNEDEVLGAMRDKGVAPGEYVFPRCESMKDMGSEEMIAKMNLGPNGWLTVMPPGPWAVGKSLGQWFIYCVIIGALVAYLMHFMIPAGADFQTVMRGTSTAAFLAYAGATPSDSIWKAQGWSTTLKFLFDGLLYSLATGAIFAAMWPGASPV